MQYSVIKAALEGIERPMDLKRNDTTKTWTLTFPHGTTPAASAHLSFEYLGAGTNKLVFHVFQNAQPTTWVLGMQHNPGSSIGERDIKAEINILNRLAHDGVSVPKPFSATATEHDLLINFEIDNHNSGLEGKVCGFSEEFYDLRTPQHTTGRYLEMDKKAGNRTTWLRTKVLEQLHPGKTQLQHLCTSFDKIKASWEKKEWGDFQVIYDTKEGILTVFDPNNDTTNAKQTKDILDQWEADLKKAAPHHHAASQSDTTPH